MKPATFYSLSVNPIRTWAELAWKTGEMMLASGQVIRHRSHRIVAAGGSPSAGDRRELALMGQEKIAAATESAQAMGLSWTTLNQQFAAAALRQMLTGTAALMSLAASRTPGQSVARQTRLVRDTMAHSAVAAAQLSKSSARVAHRGLKPIHSRATANARRLAKR